MDNELPVECYLIFTSSDLIDAGIAMPSKKGAINYFLHMEEEIAKWMVAQKDIPWYVMLLGEHKKGRYINNKFNRRNQDNSFDLVMRLKKETDGYKFVIE